jgi:hypothetical protein
MIDVSSLGSIPCGHCRFLSSKMNFVFAHALTIRTTRRKAIHLPITSKNRSLRRNAHCLPRLNYPVEKGLGTFLQPKALRTIAIDYQGGLLSRLNDLVKGKHMKL